MKSIVLLLFFLSASSFAEPMILKIVNRNGQRLYLRSPTHPEEHVIDGFSSLELMVLSKSDWRVQLPANPEEDKLNQPLDVLVDNCKQSGILSKGIVQVCTLSLIKSLSLRSSHTLQPTAIAPLESDSI